MVRWKSHHCLPRRKNNQWGQQSNLPAITKPQSKKATKPVEESSEQSSEQSSEEDEPAKPVSKSVSKVSMRL